MNGFTAADMTTAAANGFRDGFAAQPAAAQEAVGVDAYDDAMDQLWKLAGGNDSPVYNLFLGFRDSFASPVAAAPVVVAVRVEGVGTAHLHIVDGGVDIPAMTIQHMAKHLADASTPAAPVDLHAHLLHMLGAKDHEDAGRIIGELHAASMSTPEAQADGAILTNPYTGQPRDYRDVESDPAGTLIVNPKEPLFANNSSKKAWWAGYRAGKGLPPDTPRSVAVSTPAAPGIDLEQFREAVMTQHAALMDSWCGDPETKEAADKQRDRLLSLIDASPKGGSTDAKDAARYRWLRESSGTTWDQPWVAVGHYDREWDKQPNEIEGKQLDDAIDAAMQATSAEVGS